MIELALILLVLYIALALVYHTVVGLSIAIYNAVVFIYKELSGKCSNK